MITQKNSNEANSSKKHNLTSTNNCSDDDQEPALNYSYSNEANDYNIDKDDDNKSLATAASSVNVGKAALDTLLQNITTSTNNHKLANKSRSSTKKRTKLETKSTIKSKDQSSKKILADNQDERVSLEADDDSMNSSTHSITEEGNNALMVLLQKAQKGEM